MSLQKINDTLKKRWVASITFWETDINKDVAQCIECIKEVLNAH